MEENRLIRENERLDDLQNGYMLIQNPSPPGMQKSDRERKRWIWGRAQGSSLFY